MAAEVAPRSRFSSFSPVFPVHDLRRALAHYASLGFEVKPYADGDGYGFAGPDEVSLHLSLDEGHGPEAGPQHVGAAYLYVEDADALYDEWARPGVGGLTRRVGDTPYKLREGSPVDPDGNLIRFGSSMPARPAERLRAHLETRYGTTVDAMAELDLGVWRVRRAVLVTEWADPVPRSQRRDAIRAAGGLSHLGALLGRLHTLGISAGGVDVGVGAVARPGGAWHHLAEGATVGGGRGGRTDARLDRAPDSPTPSVRRSTRSGRRSPRWTRLRDCPRGSSTRTSSWRTSSRRRAAWSWSTGPAPGAGRACGRWRSCCTRRPRRSRAGRVRCCSATASTSRWKPRNSTG